MAAGPKSNLKQRDTSIHTMTVSGGGSLIPTAMHFSATVYATAVEWVTSVSLTECGICIDGFLP